MTDLTTLREFLPEEWVRYLISTAEIDADHLSAVLAQKSEIQRLTAVVDQLAHTDADSGSPARAATGTAADYLDAQRRDGWTPEQVDAARSAASADLANAQRQLAAAFGRYARTHLAADLTPHHDELVARACALAETLPDGTQSSEDTEHIGRLSDWLQLIAILDEWEKLHQGMQNLRDCGYLPAHGLRNRDLYEPLEFRFRHPETVYALAGITGPMRMARLMRDAGPAILAVADVDELRAQPVHRPASAPEEEYRAWRALRYEVEELCRPGRQRAERAAIAEHTRRQQERQALLRAERRKTAAEGVGASPLGRV